MGKRSIPVLSNCYGIVAERLWERKREGLLKARNRKMRWVRAPGFSNAAEAKGV